MYMINNPIDLMFVITAVLFNCFIICLFITFKKENLKLRKLFGALWISLIVPIVIAFIFYLLWERSLSIIISMVFILSYYLVEILLDYVFKYDFRSNWKTHVPYIILEYIALFSFLIIAFSIDVLWGWIVSITFWGIIVALIYLYAGKKPKKDKDEVTIQAI